MALRKFSKADGSAHRFMLVGSGIVLKTIGDSVKSLKVWSGTSDDDVASHWAMEEVEGYIPTEDDLNLMRRTIEDARIILESVEVE